ncbi:MULTISPECIES: cupin domain-containing protein [Spirosoma]|uniref:Cupin domain-containing protein n=1 Tax=Spirosoma liriopis TaxID=2937440 RepID=A0ABT0HFL8_9BACT|nr:MULTISPECIES: cupin domain-containing protein [Spirosoma]MCK8490956.1 cupin domain-containing protein [Spirosoma liriopis]UHG90340.1 cupin domain-containing protein [Spirosoma oryzicola]
MERITATLTNLEREVTAHAQGVKQVFLRNNDTPSNITQVAYGHFAPTDYCDLHSHQTMEECFFFLNGTGVYFVGDQAIPLHHGVFVRIPAGVLHRLEATGDAPLEYVYFGVATE